MYHLDPAMVYGERDVARWLSRVAAYEVIARDEKQAAEQAKRKG